MKGVCDWLLGPATSSAIIIVVSLGGIHLQRVTSKDAKCSKPACHKLQQT
jgi:hypothetical protein